jgi:extracellular sulfatase Sulf
LSLYFVQDYFTDLVANKSLHFIHKSILERANMPFLAVISFPAPHGPEDPAPQFSDLFDGVETHRWAKCEGKKNMKMANLY